MFCSDDAFEARWREPVQYYDMIQETTYCYYYLFETIRISIRYSSHTCHFRFMSFFPQYTGLIDQLLWSRFCKINHHINPSSGLRVTSIIFPTSYDHITETSIGHSLTGRGQPRYHMRPGNIYS